MRVPALLLLSTFSVAAQAARPGAVEALVWPVAGLGLLLGWWFCSLFDWMLMRIAARLALTAALAWVLFREHWREIALLSLLPALWLEGRDRKREDQDSGWALSGIPSLFDD